MFCGGCRCQNRRWVAVLSAAVKDEVSGFSERHQHVPGRTRDGGEHPGRHGCTTPLCSYYAHFDERLSETSTPNHANGRVLLQQGVCHGFTYQHPVHVGVRLTCCA